jgi:hypothetical protein
MPVFLNVTIGFLQRVGLDDMYRGVAGLEEGERVNLRALLATTNKKVSTRGRDMTR